MKTTIEDLDDILLSQILFRLPSCQSVVACKAVNKRLCSLISDPEFGVHFSNYKKETYTPSDQGSDIDDDEPPWTFIASVRADGAYGVCNTSNNEGVFGSPKFSMGFLPYDSFQIEATFKDLVLCSCRGGKAEETISELYVANPLTKQWVALPPCPFNCYPRAALVCQLPYGFTQDYKFRAVLINGPPPVYQMLVYCSEIGEWKRFNLRVPTNHRVFHPEFRPFEIVVCNDVIYIHEFYFVAAFNPFDVDESTDTTTIEAKLLPSLPDLGRGDCVDGQLSESSGQLFIINNPTSHWVSSVGYTINGRAIESYFKIWKLDPNEVPLTWKTTFEGLCTGNVNSRIPSSVDNTGGPITYLRMHPNNDKLIYMHLELREYQFLVCDTQTTLMKPLKRMPEYCLLQLHRLQLQWWPNLVPKAYLSNASH